MHISEGVLSGSVTVGTSVLALGVAVLSLRKTAQEDIPRISLMVAGFFVATLIHIRLGPVSTHLTLNGLMGIMLGSSSFPAILAALLLQAVLFQHGGLTSLGANSLVMGLPALVSWGLFRLGRMYKEGRGGMVLSLVTFFSGALGVVLSSLLLAGLLVFSGSAFEATAKLVLAVEMPMALAEGLITVLVVNFLLKVKPELLG